MNKTITIIVPAYNEESCVEPFVKEVSMTIMNNQSLPKVTILFVDDGSTDCTLSNIKKLAKDNSHVKYISFSRNFGKEAAIYAGLETVCRKLDSDYCVLMDADLQDPPALLPKMYELLTCKDGVERVGTRRCSRKGEPKIRSFFARMFYKLMNRFSQVDLVDGARDYQLMTKKYVAAILACKEYNRFFKGLSQWVGYRTEWLEYENIERKNGETKWSFWGLLKYSLEGIIGYSTWPLKLISIVGLFLSFISLIALVVVFVRALVCGDVVAGWPSLTCILLLLGGLILTSLGVLGLYFEKTYLEVKNRPIYLTQEEYL